MAAEAPVGERRWGIGDALLGTVVTLVVSNIVVGIVFVAAGWDLDDDIPLWGVALLQVPLWAGLLGAPLWSTYLKGRRSLAEDFGLRMRWTDVPLGVGVGIVSQLGLAIVISLVYDLLGVDTDQVGQSAEELTDKASDPVGVVLLILIVAVAAPIFEELFYRGLWLRATQHKWGTVPAVLLSSFMFAVVHFAPYDFPALFGFAIVLAILTVRTGRLGPAIAAHLVFNTVAVVTLLVEN